MSLSKKSFTAIQRALHNRTFRVALNATWRQIHNEFGVGSTAGKHLLLTPEDHEKLRKLTCLEAGADPLTTTITGDRLEAASLVRNEKWARENVFSGMIQVNVQSGEIPLSQGNAVTPPGTLLTVASADIILDGINTVLLIENGIVARYWQQCPIPDGLTNALMVYRGHATEARAVRGWLDSLPSSVKKTGYFDFDPAGLGMAIDYDLHAILIPEPLDDELLLGRNNKPEAHIEQLNQRPCLGDQLPNSCRETWDWMTSNGRKCAVTQERLMVLRWPLRVLDFK